MCKFDFEKAAHDLAILYVRNNVNPSNDLVKYGELYLNAYHQFHGYLKNELPSHAKDNRPYAKRTLNRKS